jgi:hypothetical protein
MRTEENRGEQFVFRWTRFLGRLCAMSTVFVATVVRNPAFIEKQIVLVCSRLFSLFSSVLIVLVPYWAVFFLSDWAKTLGDRVTKYGNWGVNTTHCAL